MSPTMALASKGDPRAMAVDARAASLTLRNLTSAQRNVARRQIILLSSTRALTPLRPTPTFFSFVQIGGPESGGRRSTGSVRRSAGGERARCDGEPGARTRAAPAPQAPPGQVPHRGRGHSPDRSARERALGQGTAAAPLITVLRRRQTLVTRMQHSVAFGRCCVAPSWPRGSCWSSGHRRWVWYL